MHIFLNIFIFIRFEDIEVNKQCASAGIIQKDELLWH